jgi:hypothetical protein
MYNAQVRVVGQRIQGTSSEPHKYTWSENLRSIRIANDSAKVQVQCQSPFMPFVGVARHEFIELSSYLTLYAASVGSAKQNQNTATVPLYIL